MKRIIALAALVFIIGINVAYYNTASLMYDKANIISFDNESVKLYEYDIRYKDVEYNIEKVKNILKSEYITI